MLCVFIFHNNRWFLQICMLPPLQNNTRVAMLISLKINQEWIVAHCTINNTKRSKAKTNYRNRATTRRIGKLLLFKKIYLFVCRDERAYSASATDQWRAGGLPPPRGRPIALCPAAARAVSFFKSFALNFHPISRLDSLSYGRWKNTLIYLLRRHFLRG